MKHNEEIFIRCLVQAQTQPPSESEAAGAEEYVFAQSVRKLAASDLSESELCELGLKVSSAPAGSEPARPVDAAACDGQTTREMIDATISVISDQIRNLDLEAEMMVLRKRALKRRLRILERLAKSLKPSEDDRKAA